MSTLLQRARCSVKGPKCLHIRNGSFHIWTSTHFPLFGGMDDLKLFSLNWLSTFGELVMSNRRVFLTSVGGSIAVAYSPLASSQVMCELSLPTSPRSTSFRPRVRGDALERGAQSSHDVAGAIHRNFQESIERNFSGLASSDAIELVGKLSDRELSQLAAPKSSFSVPAAMYETATYAGTR